MSTSLLVWGLLFGSVGFAFFLYGKRQKLFVPLICGLSLMTVPYFITNTVVLIVVGIALVAVPSFIRA